MSLIWMIAAGVIAALVSKMLMTHHGTGGLFILGISGSMITGAMQYSEGYTIGFVAPLIGAIILLAFYGMTARRGPVEKAGSDDIRKAA
jgi:uncharacterized membrane protein YeaQ/YmgE (transglycosylase-associated protein family)